jgi:hypothetical protein
MAFETSLKLAATWCSKPSRQMYFSSFCNLRNLGHARAAEGLQRIVGEFARAGVAANHAAAIVGGVARKAHAPALTRPTQVPKVFSLPTVPAMIA